MDALTMEDYAAEIERLQNIIRNRLPPTKDELIEAMTQLIEQQNPKPPTRKQRVEWFAGMRAGSGETVQDCIYFSEKIVDDIDRRYPDERKYTTE